VLWRACVERVASTHYPEVQFWCLQALEELIRQAPIDPLNGGIAGGAPEAAGAPAGYGALPESEKSALRSSILALLSGHSMGGTPPLGAARGQQAGGWVHRRRTGRGGAPGGHTWGSCLGLACVCAQQAVPSAGAGDSEGLPPCLGGAHCDHHCGAEAGPRGRGHGVPSGWPL